jgi:hypothetical protein
LLNVLFEHTYWLWYDVMMTWLWLYVHAIVSWWQFDDGVSSISLWYVFMVVFMICILICIYDNCFDMRLWYVIRHGCMVWYDMFMIYDWHVDSVMIIWWWHEISMIMLCHWCERVNNIGVYDYVFMLCVYVMCLCYGYMLCVYNMCFMYVFMVCVIICVLWCCLWPVFYGVLYDCDYVRCSMICAYTMCLGIWDWYDESMIWLRQHTWLRVRLICWLHDDDIQHICSKCLFELATRTRHEIDVRMICWWYVIDLIL